MKLRKLNVSIRVLLVLGVFVSPLFFYLYFPYMEIILKAKVGLLLGWLVYFLSNMIICAIAGILIVACWICIWLIGAFIMNNSRWLEDWLE